jgi:hypothetical protein
MPSTDVALQHATAAVPPKTPEPYMRLPPSTKLQALGDVPPELQAAPHWLLCKFVRDGDKHRKVPVYADTLEPRSGTQGEPEDLAQLVTFEDARTKLAELWAEDRDDYALGFAVLPDGPATCVDLDGPGAVEQHRALLDATWAEASVSGTGAHAWFAGGVDLHGKSHAAGVEVFSRNGFVVVTGLPLPGATSAARRDLAAPSAAVVEHLRKALGDGAAPAAKVGKPANIPSTWNAKRAADLKAALRTLNADMSYPDWNLVGMALHSADPDPDGAAFDLWHRWSKRGAKFAGVQDLRTHWRSYKPNGGVTVATIFGLAKEAANGRTDLQAPATPARARKAPQEEPGKDQDLDFPPGRSGGGAADDDLAAAPAPQHRAPHRFDLGVVAATDTRSPHIYVEGLLSQGCNLLVAVYKTGKTFLMLQLAAALNTGKAFLGCRVTRPYKVAVLALEEGKADSDKPEDSPTYRLAQRIRQMGLREDTQGVSLYLEVDNTPGDGGAAFLERLFDEHDCVLIDSLAKLRQLPSATARNGDVWGSDYAIVEHYRDRTTKDGKLLVLVAHANKMGNSADPEAAIVTTGGSLSSADGYLVLQRADKKDDQRLRLTVRGRDQTIDPLELRFLPQTLHWVSLGPWVDMSPQEQELLDHLASLPEGQTATYEELARALDSTEGNVQKTCSYLQKKGLVRNTARRRAGKVGAPRAGIEATDAARRRWQVVQEIEAHQMAEAARRAHPVPTSVDDQWHALLAQ